MRRRVPIIVASGNGASAMAAGMLVLARGGSALDAVEACAKIIEADPTDTSVGRGGKPNVLGEVELDASIMDGTTHRTGAVAALHGYFHPISVARAVMERTPHVFIVGEGAARFAREIGAARARNLTASTRELWIERLRRAGETPAGIRRRAKLLPVVRLTTREERGTVNFLALDRSGDVASAVTTSGWAYKYPGRVGDSPVIGAGNYCDSRYGAAACTGYGELAIRSVTAKTAVDRLASGLSAEAVARAAIVDANTLDDAAFNIVVLGARGAHAAATNREGRRYAWMTPDMTEPVIAPRALVRAPSPGARARRSQPSSRASARGRPRR
ncbi:MAG TPA: N(4)-(beta-N-acetylglucosaminyl)-L-asparaginase [Candidatus Limnocylindria bacterium]|nr:N(4)-(beta-N-acetylglucosaminyl)-L-asparaginase [Candidatus Limnocylindria bacterium]